MIDIFDEIRERLEMRDVAVHYGFEPNRGAFIRCPFHNEDTPSLKLYEHSFFCFGCGVGGDAVAFVQRLFGGTATEAARRLNDDFHLGLPMDGAAHETTRAAARREEVALARRRFNLWREKMLNTLTLAFRTAHFAFLKVGEQGGMDGLTAEELLAVKWQSTIEAMLDTLLHGSLDQQMEIFRAREAIDRLCGRILQDTQKR